MSGIFHNQWNIDKPEAIEYPLNFYCTILFTYSVSYEEQNKLQKSYLMVERLAGVALDQPVADLHGDLTTHGTRQVLVEQVKGQLPIHHPFITISLRDLNLLRTLLRHRHSLRAARSLLPFVLYSGGRPQFLFREVFLWKHISKGLRAAVSGSDQIVEGKAKLLSGVGGARV